MINSYKKLNGKRILITGGTGSFGNHVVEKLLDNTNPDEIIILSRDEKKQFDMRNKFHNFHNLKFYIGDVRDKKSVMDIMKDVNFVFHAAALKQVPTCEFFPMEAVKTNIIGTSNVLDSAEECGVEKVVVLSTDKAVYPINAMGMSKALLEKLVLAKARISKSTTTFCGVRYGNVMYSRGSVIPLFIEQIRKNIPITVTNPNMTRYLLPLPVAIDLVLFALVNGKNGDIFVRKSPASTVKIIAEVLIDIFHHRKGIKEIGIREGEKMHETLVTREELIKADNYEKYYRIKNLLKIDYDKFFSLGKHKDFPKEGYTSENTERLNITQTKKLILSLREIKMVMKGKDVQLD
jgi:UDP-glucose 4-epimerase